MMVKLPSVDRLYRKAVASLKSGDLNGAARCYGSALELDPTHLPALNNLAAMRAALGYPAAAMGMHSLFCSRTHQAWRWMLSRSDIPWYRSMRLFRQTTPENWRRPIGALHEVLLPLSKP